MFKILKSSCVLGILVVNRIFRHPNSSSHAAK